MAELIGMKLLCRVLKLTVSLSISIFFHFQGRQCVMYKGDLEEGHLADHEYL